MNTEDQDALVAVRKFKSTVQAAEHAVDQARLTAMAELRTNTVCAKMLAGGLAPNQIEEALVSRTNN